ncbi:hypothetical protein [Paraburkholderia acidisoli]|uniref:Uncharacterized protein n=1 Tax=Paraburkholderia acidisoli TaxID=2571748 RepID=A0A7Z2JI77_9BURK|nr:hypothetical protein [Paraburkholderia acidisoli]QGZ64913.1 hypothetical protein FAZ98_24215 [Paraburkholderia acidisoli]
MNIRIARSLACAVVASGAAAAAVTAYAQAIAPQPVTPMAKTPEVASGAASATNPDHMPMKKPHKRATNDEDIARPPPASGAAAK